MEKTLKEYRTKQEQLYATNAMQKTLLESNDARRIEIGKAHDDEKKYVYGELKTSKDHILELDKEIVLLKGRNRHLVAENNKLNEDNRDMKQLKDDLKETEKQLFQQTENNKILTERTKKYENKINDLEEEIESIRKESIQTLKKFNDEKETTLSLRDDIKNKDEALVEANSIIEDKTKIIAAKGTDIEDLYAKIKELENVIQNDKETLEATVDTYEKSIEELKAANQITLNDLGDLDLRMLHLREDYEGSQMRYEDLVVKTLNLEHNVNILDLEVEDRDDEIEQLKAYIEEINAMSRPGSSLKTGNERLGEGPSSSSGTRGYSGSASSSNGELSERETNMVKALHGLQGQLSNLQAQHQGLQQR